MRGRFIVFEGLDRSGKSTQVDALVSRLEQDGRTVKLRKFPAEIESDLARGIDVIADRYAFSGIAFSAAKGLDFEYCLSPDRGLPMPDVVVFLTISPQVASARAAYGKERYETTEIQQKVRSQFARVKERVLAMHGSWADIDADGEIDEVRERIWAVVKVVEGAPEKAKGLWEN